MNPAAIGAYADKAADRERRRSGTAARNLSGC
jgi:hypothetical protein